MSASCHTPSMRYKRPRRKGSMRLVVTGGTVRAALLRRWTAIQQYSSTLDSCVCENAIQLQRLTSSLLVQGFRLPPLLGQNSLSRTLR